MDGTVMWPYLIPIVGIIGGIAVAVASTVAKARVRELEVRERIAMIEKGLVPPPEVDPRGFERAMGRIDRLQGAPRAQKLRGGGIMLIGLGLGLMILLSLVDSPRDGIGVGSLFICLGGALVVSAVLHGRSASAADRPAAAPPPTSPGDAASR